VGHPRERFGEPTDAFQLEEDGGAGGPGAFEVIRASSWAAGRELQQRLAAPRRAGFGVPLSPNEDHHKSVGSDASGVVWAVGEGVTRWKPGDEVVVHCNQGLLEDPEVHGFDPLSGAVTADLGLRDELGSVCLSSAKVQGPSSCLPEKPKHLRLGGGPVSYGLTLLQRPTGC